VREVGGIEGGRNEKEWKRKREREEEWKGR